MNIYINDTMFCFITGQLLKLEGKDFEKARAELKRVLVTYEFDVLKKPNTCSVGAQYSIRKKPMTYFNWIKALKKKGAKSVFADFPRNEEDTSGIPAHVRAAFANSKLVTIHIPLKDHTQAYAPMTVFSPDISMSGREFKKLIDFQFVESKHRNALWEHLLNTTVKRYTKYSNATTIRDARQFVDDMVGDRGDKTAAHFLLHSAQVYCANRARPFKVPESMLHYFFDQDSEPYKSKLKRQLVLGFSIGESYLPYEEGLLELKPSKEAWSFLRFSLLTDYPGHPQHVPHDIGATKARFAKALVDIEAFATKVNNPFVDRFRSALWILNNDHLSWVGDSAYAKSLETMRAKGFQRESIEFFKYKAPLFSALGVSDEQARAILSTSEAHVFGGMGSWNDYGYDGEDGKTYDRVTAELYSAMSLYSLASLLPFATVGD